MDDTIVNSQTSQQSEKAQNNSPQNEINISELTEKLSELERKLVAEKNIRNFEREAILMGIRSDRISVAAKISGVEDTDRPLNADDIRQIVWRLIKDFPEIFQKARQVHIDQSPGFSSTPVKSNDPIELLKAMRIK